MAGAGWILVARVATLAVILAGSLALATSPAAADVGIKDWSWPTAFQSAASSSKPESKLWYNDGSWWASMVTPLGGNRIHQLSGGTWVDTGTALDQRMNSRADVLWDAATSKLYVASHTFTEESSRDGTGTDGQLFRYSYDKTTKTYALDDGFPVAVGSPVTETLVIDKDSLGRIWATWASDGWIYANHTDGSDTSWGKPYVIPGTGWGYHDDIPTIVAFDGGWVGVLWSNQYLLKLRFIVHKDTWSDTQWGTAEEIPVGFGADDHLNLKVASNGELFGAIKNEENGANGGAPLTYLIKRSRSGEWSSFPYGNWPQNTRPILLLDEAARQVHMVSTCPQPPATSGQAGGDICEKVTSMDNPSFDLTTRGTPLMSDALSPKINNVTSTKQGISAETGMVLLASDDELNTYWHSETPLSTNLPAPKADFSATAAGTAPTDVELRDTSTGAPKAWQWEFGDGTSSRTRNPTHRYNSSGTYTVTLRVVDDLGRADVATRRVEIADALQDQGQVVVPPPPPPPAPEREQVPQPPAPSLAAVGLTSSRTTIPYGSTVTVTALVSGEHLGAVGLALQGTRFPFDRAFDNLLPASSIQGAGVKTFTLTNVRTALVMQAVADGRVRSNLLRLKSAARATIASLRRKRSRVVVIGTVQPFTPGAVVTVQRKSASGRYQAIARGKLLKGGRFSITVRASAGQRLRVLADPRDDGAHVPGASSGRVVARR